MFAEILIGTTCSLMGIALGYVAILSLFTGIQFLSKKKKITDAENTTVRQNNLN